MERRISRRAAIVMIVAVLGVLIGGGTASGRELAGSCPDSYSLVNARVDPVVDKNGDGKICTKQIGAPSGVTAFSDIDNNAQG
jgi:hypothetical protein